MGKNHRRKKKKGNFFKNIKKGVVLIVGGFFILEIALNSTQFREHKENVYASLKEQYIQTNNSNQAIQAIETVESTSAKNLYLDVDMDLRTPSNVTAEEINKMLEGTALYGLGEAFVKAEKEYNVNALYMMGLACVESAWGTSNFAVNRNNLYGWNAVDSNPNKATSFKSKEDATLYVAKKLQQNYLTQDGAYFEGYSARSIDVHYCTDKQHADKIVNTVNELVKKLG